MRNRGASIARAREATARAALLVLACAVMAALPIQSRANTWGEEVYFDTGVEAALEADAAQVVDPGTVCFWVEGRSLALPYGPTPASRGDECRLVTEVNLLGRLQEDPRVLAGVREGMEITVEAAG